jgi:hypothetical protein
LRAGNVKPGVRWNSSRRSAVCAISGPTWMPDEPVPISPTALPAKSISSWGQREVK